MAFKIALLAAVCIAQGLAFQPMVRRQDVCKNPSFEFPYEMDQAMNEMDEVRDNVSLTAMEAYAKGTSLKVILACFRQQRGNYIRLGLRVSRMVTDATLEIGLKLAEKADRYTRLIEPPMVNIALTVAKLPETVYNHIQNKEFIKAAEAVIEARRTIDTNAREIAKHVADMAGEIPELAERTAELAKGIHTEAKETCNAINQAFRQCVEEGGPKVPNFKEEGEDELSESSEE